MFRTLASSLLALLATCGPMYGKPQPAQQTSVPAEQVAGPPGGGSDPWSPPATNASPDDPYAAAPARKPAPAPAPPKPAKPSGGGKLSADSQALLDAHNRVRAKHCAGPLAGSPKLEQAAQQWASTRVRKG